MIRVETFTSSAPSMWCRNKYNEVTFMDFESYATENFDTLITCGEDMDILPRWIGYY